MLKIWGRISSINVRKVVLDRAGAGPALRAHRRRPRVRHRAQRPTTWRTNPNALVPTARRRRLRAVGIQRDRALPVRAARARARCTRETLRQRFDAERWMDWQQTTLNPRRPRRLLCSWSARPAEQRDRSRDRAVDRRDRAAGGAARCAPRAAPFMAGERFTMADIPIACEMHRWWGLPLAHARACRTCSAGTTASAQLPGRAAASSTFHLS